MDSLHENHLADSSAADLVIDALALSETELVERVASLEADITTYRELAQVAIAALSEQTRDCERQQSRVLALVAENRALRGELQMIGAQLRASQQEATAA